eukprot:780638-Rhodomonas_salina.2
MLAKRSAAMAAAGVAARSGTSQKVFPRATGMVVSRNFSDPGQAPGDLIRPGQIPQAPANPPQAGPPGNDPWVEVQDKNTG